MGHIKCIECLKEAQLSGHINCIECLKEAQLSEHINCIECLKEAQLSEHINCTECLKEAQLRCYAAGCYERFDPHCKGKRVISRLVCAQRQLHAFTVLVTLAVRAFAQMRTFFCRMRCVES